MTLLMLQIGIWMNKTLQINLFIFRFITIARQKNLCLFIYVILGEPYLSSDEVTERGALCFR